MPPSWMLKGEGWDESFSQSSSPLRPFDSLQPSARFPIQDGSHNKRRIFSARAPQICLHCRLTGSANEQWLRAGIFFPPLHLPPPSSFSQSSSPLGSLLTRSSPLRIFLSKMAAVTREQRIIQRLHPTKYTAGFYVVRSGPR